MPIPPDLQRVRDDVQEHENRLVRTAFDRALAALRDEDPKDVSWLHDHVAEVVNRLVSTNEVGQSTAVTYASRVRGAIERYHARLSQPIARTGTGTVLQRVDLRRHGGGELPKLTPREQVGEAFTALGRWPDLIPYLAPGLIEAQRKIVEGGE